MEQKSQSERTEMEKMRATADQQPTLVASEIAVKVATQKKIEMITLAEGSADAKALLKAGFKFVGSTICYAFMQASGMVNDHLVNCHRHAAVMRYTEPH